MIIKRCNILVALVVSSSQSVQRLLSRLRDESSAALKKAVQSVAFCTRNSFWLSVLVGCIAVDLSDGHVRIHLKAQMARATLFHPMVERNGPPFNEILAPRETYWVT